jgi:dihydropteroate synthase
MNHSESRVLKCGDREFDLNHRTLVMGILNVTPDSFSDGGQFLGADDAVNHGLEMAKQGADILDVGGESTRPGAEPVSVEDEMKRVIPVVRALVKKGFRQISIDTRHAQTAAAALEAGASWVNDVMGMRDPEMVSSGKSADAYVIMHTRDVPKTMQTGVIHYDDVVREIFSFLKSKVEAALQQGYIRSQLLVDPGIGFGKELEHNLMLTKSLNRFQGSGGVGVLYGPSRKRFLGELTGIQSASERDWATVGAASFAAQAGADIVRVHNVKATVEAIRVVDAINAAQN